MLALADFLSIKKAIFQASKRFFSLISKNNYSFLLILPTFNCAQPVRFKNVLPFKGYSTPFPVFFSPFPLKFTRTLENLILAIWNQYVVFSVAFG